MRKLIERLKQDNEFYYSDIHGRKHYANVMAAGLELADYFKLNPKLFKYFAYLHDSCRKMKTVIRYMDNVRQSILNL